VDILITLGEVATNEVCKRRNLKKPVIAPLVIDAEIQELPIKDGTSGVRNLSYINTYRNFSQSIKRFQEVTDFRRLAVLVDNFMITSIPNLKRLVGPVARQAEIRIDLVRVESSAEAALLRIPPGVDAVLTTGLPRLTPAEFEILVTGLIERRLPSAASTNYEEVAAGILATMVPSSAKQQLARNVAINTYEVMRGEDAGKLSTAFNEGEALTINMATARAIGVQPGWRVMSEAELINEAVGDRDQRITLYEAVKEALAVNLDLAAAGKKVTAGEESVKERRSGLLPQIGISSQARIIDQDRAESSLGVYPEKLWTGSATATQLIYSEKTWAGYEIEKHLQDFRVEELATARLDIMQLTAVTYLNVLRVKSIEQIQKENLKLTRANLERARVRVSTGVAGPEEVYRWESQIADSKQFVLRAESATLDSINAVNRILNRPLQAPFVPEEIDYADPLTTIGSPRPHYYLENTKTLNEMRDFLISEGIADSPELKQLDAAIEARERSVVASKRDFWVPTFELAGDVTEQFVREGAGKDRPAGSSQDDTLWSAGVVGSIPLFTSGRKTSTLRRTREELTGLKLTRTSAEQRIEERIYNAVHLVRASYPSIEFSKDATRAAKLNLDLITENYTRGTKSIIDLLDAQNQALTVDQRAVNAVYDFLIDMMSVQRSIGRFLFYESRADQEAWYDRLDAFITEKRRVKPRLKK
jgi:outer membrane protein